MQKMVIGPLLIIAKYFSTVESIFLSARVSKLANKI